MASRRNFFTSNQTGTPGPAGASFERNFFDFVETSQDPDVHRTTSTVTALPGTHRENRIRYIISPPCSAPNAEPSTVLDLPATPTVTWIWCKNFLNWIHACGKQNV